MRPIWKQKIKSVCWTCSLLLWFRVRLCFLNKLLRLVHVHLRHVLLVSRVLGEVGPAAVLLMILVVTHVAAVRTTVHVVALGTVVAHLIHGVSGTCGVFWFLGDLCELKFCVF